MWWYSLSAFISLIALIYISCISIKKFFQDFFQCVLKWYLFSFLTSVVFFLFFIYCQCVALNLLCVLPGMFCPGKVSCDSLEKASVWQLTCWFPTVRCLDSQSPALQAAENMVAFIVCLLPGTFLANTSLSAFVLHYRSFFLVCLLSGTHTLACSQAGTDPTPL